MWGVCGTLGDVVDDRLPAGRSRAAGPSLFVLVAGGNAVVLVGACLVVGLALAPGGLGRFALDEGIVIVVGLGLLAVLDVVLLRRAFRPLERLTGLAVELDPGRPGTRADPEVGGSEVRALSRALNGMLERMEDERAESTRRVLEAQERERERVARELHDEVGQTLTAVLLQIEHWAHHAPPELAPGLEELREAARAGLEDVRRIATELRPEALDDLGLGSALLALCDRLEAGGHVRIERGVARGLSPLPPEQELVVYRIAQEALTNALRHSGSGELQLEFAAEPGAVVLSVTDRGRGFAGAREGGGGLRGMRERARLIGAELSVGEVVGGGVEVSVRVATGPAGV